MLHPEKKVLTLCVLLCFGLVNVTAKEIWNLPPGFSVGVATSAFQIEGAWNISDKSESAWDHFVHTHPEKINNRSNADVACDSYHKFREDVKLLKIMGIQHYRFSIAWTRLLPKGYSNYISEDGRRYYNELINELLKYNITPMVTIYHWDHPQIFQVMGGWTNEIMVELYANYARVVFKEFGDRVKIFTTINEPESICKIGYSLGVVVPGVKLGKYAEYLCSTNILKAHARAYHIYDKEFRPRQRGKIGIVLNIQGAFSKNEDDDVSNEVAFQFNCGLYAHPIFSKTGDFPAVLKERVNENSKYEKLPSSRLPTLSQEWIDYIKGTADYMGVNYYYSMLVEPAPKPNDTIYKNDDGLLYTMDENWRLTSVGLPIVPEGLSAVLYKVYEEYDNPPVYITEIGIADNGQLEDDGRIEYLYLLVKYTLEVINTIAADIRATTFWSLMDNFEWTSGYAKTYGIYSVDFKSPSRKRTPKHSAFWLQDVLETRKLLPPPKVKRKEKHHFKF